MPAGAKSLTGRSDWNLQYTQKVRLWTGETVSINFHLSEVTSILSGSDMWLIQESTLVSYCSSRYLWWCAGNLWKKEPCINWQTCKLPMTNSFKSPYSQKWKKKSNQPLKCNLFCPTEPSRHLLTLQSTFSHIEHTFLVYDYPVLECATEM